jgi:myo-inositol-1(or 4)-monophosphatase
MLAMAGLLGQRVKSLTSPGLEGFMAFMSTPFSSTGIDLSLCLQTAFSACDGASRVLQEYFGNLKNVDEKFQAGLVSEADRLSEQQIVQVLRARFPEHAVLGEEGGVSGAVSEGLVPTNGALWMIDPLDGTTNYVHRFPAFCISIGLEFNGELVLGVVDAPKLGRRYHAIKGGGAFLNGEKIHVSERTEFREGLFATGFWGSDESLDEQFEISKQIVRKARGFRRAGAAALDLCFVAEGVFDAFWEKGLSPWDTAAGVIIAREAGAVATDMDGQAFNPRLKSVACGSPIMHKQLLELIERVRNKTQP